MQQELACHKALCKNNSSMCRRLLPARAMDWQRFAMPGCNQTFGLYFILKND